MIGGIKNVKIILTKNKVRKIMWDILQEAHDYIQLDGKTSIECGKVSFISEDALKARINQILNELKIEEI